MSIGWLQIILAVALDFIVIYFLLRGARRRFPLVFAFCLLQILITCINAIAPLIGRVNRQLYLQIYWTGDLVAHAAISVLMISLIWQTFEDKDHRTKIVSIVAAGVISLAIASAYVFFDPHISRWMTPLSRNLSFGEEVLNLILWSILLKTRASDYLLLMVSAGIGVQVTGEVIGHTLRLYTRSTLWVPNLLVYISEIVCLCIWIWAFRAAAKGQVPPAAAAGLPAQPSSL